MDPKSNPPSRIEQHNAGLGEVSRRQIEMRAAELARSDGRDAFSDGDLQQAYAELQGPVEPPAPPEVAETALEEVVAWDEPVEATGHRAPTLEIDDENITPEQLVQEGLEEADHDQRLAASEDEEA